MRQPFTCLSSPALAANTKAKQAISPLASRVGCSTFAQLKPSRNLASTKPPGERAEMYPKVTAVAPAFAESQAKTSRVIPLFELHRA